MNSLVPVLAAPRVPELAAAGERERWAREYWTSRPSLWLRRRTPRIADHPSTATQRRPSGFHQELSPATSTRLIFDAVARTASSLKRDRRFADSPLEGDGFEPSVPRQIRSRFESSPPPM